MTNGQQPSASKGQRLFSSPYFVLKIIRYFSLWGKFFIIQRYIASRKALKPGDLGSNPRSGNYMSSPEPRRLGGCHECESPLQTTECDADVLITASPSQAPSQGSRLPRDSWKCYIRVCVYLICNKKVLKTMWRIYFSPQRCATLFLRSSPCLLNALQQLCPHLQV